jgi:large subunit ribosomal protein L25
MEKEKKTLSVKLRTRAGKGAARADRRAGNVPGVIYGDNKPLVLFSVSALDLAAELRKPGFRTHIYEIDAEGEKIHAICQDIQRDIIYNTPIHIDFLRVNKSSEIKVDVPVVLVNEDSCVGVKVEGGLVNIVAREVPLLCHPDSIPENLIVDVANLHIGESLHLGQIKLPEGVRSENNEEELTLVTIHAPMAAEAEETTEEAAAAPATTPAAADKKE